MSASDLKFVIFRNVNDGYWRRLRSARVETIEISEEDTGIRTAGNRKYST